ncbi:MAG: response regulator transcription factor [Bacteroidetes bacterium]|nr:response regulator transcription factor [Bacteroidota bacterium]
MNLKCYVIDDETHAIEVLARYINNTPGLELIATDKNPLEAVRKISDGEISPDITFADIDMPGITGMQFAELAGDSTLIIFATAFPNYAVNAFEKNALDYILKPITYERFLKAVDKARKKISESKPKAGAGDDYFFVKSDIKGKLIKVFVSDIIYIEAKLNYISIVQDKNNYLAYLTMAEIEDKLPADKFMRCHRSFIANLEKVQIVESDLITFTEGSKIVLSSTYRAKFMAAIGQKLIKSKRI